MTSYGRLFRQIGTVTTIPMILVAGPLIGYWIGQFGDDRFGTDPWGKTGMACLGFVASLRQVIVIIRRWVAETEKD